MRTGKVRRIAAIGVLAGVIAATLYAAAPAPGPAPGPELDVLEEVTVTATVPRPLEDYVEFPRSDSVVVSPRGTRIAMG